MAIQFVVETGAGLTNSTSYVSEADADQIIENYGMSWPDSYTSDQKQQALNSGTRYLDDKYHDQWKGTRTNEDQALDWPRYNVVDRDGFYIDDDVIPSKLEIATVVCATYWAENDQLFPDLDDAGTLKKEKIKIDVIEIENEFLGGNSGSETATQIESLLTDYIEGTGLNVEVRRG